MGVKWSCSNKKEATFNNANLGSISFSNPIPQTSSSSQEYPYENWAVLWFVKEPLVLGISRNSRIQELAVSGYLKTIRIKSWLVLGISKPSKNRQFPWKNSQFFLGSLTVWIFLLGWLQQAGVSQNGYCWWYAYLYISSENQQRAAHHWYIVQYTIFTSDLYIPSSKANQRAVECRFRKEEEKGGLEGELRTYLSRATNKHFSWHWFLCHVEKGEGCTIFAVVLIWPQIGFF